MNNLLRALVLASISMATTSAGAAEPGDKVTRSADGKVTVSSVFMAPNTCYSAGQAATGSPPDAVSVDNAILITQPLEHSGDQMCLMMLKPVQFSITTDVPEGAQAIVIYSLDEKTRTVTARALAIPSQ
jgi:hypothetical protein